MVGVFCLQRYKERSNSPPWPNLINNSLWYNNIQEKLQPLIYRFRSHLNFYARKISNTMDLNKKIVSYKISEIFIQMVFYKQKHVLTTVTRIVHIGIRVELPIQNGGDTVWFTEKQQFIKNGFCTQNLFTWMESVSPHTA